jgi:hypothetical protein
MQVFSQGGYHCASVHVLPAQDSDDHRCVDELVNDLVAQVCMCVCSMCMYVSDDHRCVDELVNDLVAHVCMCVCVHVYVCMHAECLSVIHVLMNS